jgi:hypothetical protein
MTSVDIKEKRLEHFSKQKSIIIFAHALFENAEAKVNTAKTAAPNINVFFLPYASPTLPETSRRQP